MSWLKKLTSGLSKTSAKVTASLSSLLGRPAIDAASIEEVEDGLIAADLGTRVAARLAEGVRRHKFDGDGTAPALAAALADSIPVGRLGQPEDVSNAFLFFCDPASGFVTGQTLYVCGGASIGTLTI